MSNPGTARTAEGRRRGALDLTVVVVVCDIPREAPRSLFSLSPRYQRHIDPADYEVIVVDNGSSPPLERRAVEALAPNFRLLGIDQASPSPAKALNRGIAEARGDIIGVMVDGARLATPGLLHFARHGAGLYQRAVVATLGYYLGYDFQRWAMQARYDQAREDALLDSIAWPQDGYRLFEIATFDESSVDGWLQPIAESNALFLRRELWDALDGVDERFDQPGGGLLNLDTYRRAVELPESEIVLLLGEGTFHQLHGGVATNIPANQFPASWRRWADQYEAVRGERYTLPRPRNPPTFIGRLPRSVLARFARAALAPAPHHESPLGPDFDPELWSLAPTARPSDPIIADLLDLAHDEFRAGRYACTAAIARLIRERQPDEPESQRLLTLVAPWLPVEGPPAASRADHFLALGRAHGLLGETELAAANYRAALSLEPDLVQAHIGLANQRLSGEFYYDWIDRLYTSLAPETIIEIGVAEGVSLAYARPPTLAIGVDPLPKVRALLKTETHIFTETSADFFARHGPDALLAGRPLGVGFIDGLHLYEQALKDFIALESYCGPRSVILLHDTLPLDEATQSRTRGTQFHTGDVWKTVVCLKHYRPDLDIFTIAARWTGLTVVIGLDPASRVLADHYDEAVERFIDLPFSAVADRLDDALNIVANDWTIVEARLKARQIL